MEKDRMTIVPRKWRGLLVIVTAALLLEMLSGAQYYLTRQMMADELEKRAESELTLKAILIKSNLNDAEDALTNYQWKIQAHLDQPDSAFITMRRLVANSRQLQGAGLGFEKDYYPQKGHLFEAYAGRDDDGEVEVKEIDEDHDYTQLDIYKKALVAEKGFWSEPYFDKVGSHKLVTSYFQPVHDGAGKVVGAVSVDFSLSWLSDTINKRHIYPSSFIMVLTEHNVRVIEPSANRIDKKTTDYIYSLITDSTVEHKLSNSGRSTMVHFSTVERDGIIFYANMKGYPKWKIAVVCYDDEVYASLKQLRLWFLLLMFVAFGILLYVVWRFMRSEKKMVSTSLLLEEKSKEQERMDAELRIANNIQQALLPLAEPSLQGVSDVDVVGRLIPAKAVGGDLYSMFVRNGKLFFCIGDVSGKGVPAALLMAVTQTLFHNIASHEDNPARIMEQMNESACRNNTSNFFVTLFIGVLDLPTGHLRYCNAGHDVPYILNEELKMKDEESASSLPESAVANAQFIPLHSQFSNIPIGLFADIKYQMQSLTMSRGATLFLYTDGLTEARNASRGFFGNDQLKELLNRCTDMKPKEIVDKVISEVDHFVGSVEQSDDLTLLVIRYAKPERQLILDEQLTLSNDVKEVSRLSMFIKDVMGRLDIGKPLGPKLRLALEEAVVNVMEYAYPAGTKGDVSVRVTFDGDRLQLIISDRGIAFNPTEASNADITLSAEERPVGGLGILLMRELMDFINYERVNGQNILTLTKRSNNN